MTIYNNVEQTKNDTKIKCEALLLSIKKYLLTYLVGTYGNNVPLHWFSS